MPETPAPHQQHPRQRAALAAGAESARRRAASGLRHHRSDSHDASPGVRYSEPLGFQRREYMHHFIDLLDWDGNQILKLLKDAARLKKSQLKGKHKPRLEGKVLGMVFEKPSLRTRVSFQAGMAQLGGQAIFLNGLEVGLGKRETLPDIARTLCEYVDAIVLRTFEHENVVEFARCSTKPVINGLSDYYHPCQALGDLLTMRECCGDLQGKTITFVGDGNNVARSLAIACGKIGVRFILSAPQNYRFDPHFLETYQKEVRGQLEEIEDPLKAVAEADVIYTDVWARS